MIRCPGCGEENPSKFRLCGYCGTPLDSAAAVSLPPHEVRKTVTIVFSDLQGSTALGEHIDSEALHEVKERYFDAMATEIFRHGGKIEKYIGDAIMAVFGLPRAHEDDALRAVRAAAGMRSALAQLNQDLLAAFGVVLGSRTGINTGEVVANDDPSATQKLVTGDAVNVAARLEQAAPENQIYLGRVTFQLVRDAVQAEPVEPLELKGKAERVPAYRLVAVTGNEGIARRIDTPIVGRDAELESLGLVYHEVCKGRTARLVTVIGDAGVGKSRLVHEFVERVAAGARALHGRCLPYGDGITFWPLVGMVTLAAGIYDGDSPDEACNKLIGVVGQADLTERLASAIGLTTATFPLGEINWAARKFFEMLATDAPLVVVVDDIHWAEDALLELLEHVRDAAVDAPILLLTTARHDLLEAHPGWGTKPNQANLALRPLDDAATARIVASLFGSADLPPDIVARVVGAAEGNPLYVEQMLGMLIDNQALRMHEGHWVRAVDKAELLVPPTINALLEARLDQLGREVRATVGPASVIGLEFSQAAVESMMPDVLCAQAGEHLETLTRKRFIRPAPVTNTEIVYRFDHHLVRDTVYNGLLKRARATLHLEFVRWADRINTERERGLELEEILGYHLEQAQRYLSELGPLDENAVAIGVDAARRLSNAAKRALMRGDMHAAANLYGRAVALLREDDPSRLALLPDFGEALLEIGDFVQARAVLDAAQTSAERAGHRRLAATAQLARMRARLFSAEPGDWSEETLHLAHEAIPLFEGEEAHSELAHAWRLVALVHGVAARYGQSDEAMNCSIAHARLAGDERLIARAAVGISSSTLLGPMPVPQAIARCERLIADGISDRQAEGRVLCALAQLHAMNGDFGQARDLCRRGRAQLRELGQGVNVAATAIDVLTVELLAGDLAAAEREVMPDYEFLVRAGETYFMPTMAALLSRIVRDQGRDDDALAFSKAAEKASAADDIESQALWRSIRAPIAARAGKSVEAESLARSAVEMSQRTDAPQMQADALSELATVLILSGRIDESRRTMDAAIAIYEAKGDVVSAARSKAWVAQIDGR